MLVTMGGSQVGIQQNSINLKTKKICIAATHFAELQLLFLKVQQRHLLKYCTSVLNLFDSYSYRLLFYIKKVLYVIKIGHLSNSYFRQIGVVPE